MYSYKIFSSINEECEKNWRNIENNSYSNFFQSFDYIKEIIKKNNSNIKIVFIFKKKEVIAILPLEIKKYFMFNVLQWIGTKEADYCNPLLVKNFENNLNKSFFLETWNTILSNIGKIDLIFLNKQLSYIQDIENPFIQFFKTTLFSKIYLINLKDKFGDYKDEIKYRDKKHHYKIHRTILKLEKLKKLFNYNFFVKNLHKNDIDFEEIIEQKKKYLYKKRKKNNLNKNFIKIFNHMIKLKKIKFFSMEIKVNDKIISKCFSFIYKNIFYYYIPVMYSKEFNNYKPGMILIVEIIKWCIKNNIKKFDFGLGEENYKRPFSNEVVSLHRYIKHNTLKGKILYLMISVLLIFRKL